MNGIINKTTERELSHFSSSSRFSNPHNWVTFNLIIYNLATLGYSFELTPGSYHNYECVRAYLKRAIRNSHYTLPLNI